MVHFNYDYTVHNAEHCIYVKKNDRKLMWYSYYKLQQSGKQRLLIKINAIIMENLNKSAIFDTRVLPIVLFITAIILVRQKNYIRRIISTQCHCLAPGNALWGNNEQEHNVSCSVVSDSNVVRCHQLKP